MQQSLILCPRWLVMPRDELRDPLGCSTAAGLVGPATRMVEVAGEDPTSVGQTLAQPWSDTAEQHAGDPVPEPSLGWLRNVVQQASLHQLLVGPERTQDLRSALGVALVRTARDDEAPGLDDPIERAQNGGPPSSSAASALAGRTTSGVTMSIRRYGRTNSTSSSSSGPYCS